MSGKVTGRVLRLGPADTRLLLVLIVFADAARHDGGGIELSITDIARRARISRAVASERVNRLIADKWIERLWVGRAGFPSHYRIGHPLLVDNPDVVRPRANDVVRARAERRRSGQRRTTSFGPEPNDRRDTGMTGFNGRGNGAGSAGRRRASSTAADHACERCHGTGWYEPKRNAPVIECDHSPASESREVPDGF